jgi:amino acid transporter
MTVNASYQLVWTLVCLFLWPTVVFIRAKHLQRKSPSDAFLAAVVAFVASIYLMILIFDALMVSPYRSSTPWIALCIWIVIPLLWLLVRVVRARRKHPSE